MRTAGDGCAVQHESGGELITASPTNHSDDATALADGDTGAPVFTRKPPACIRTMESFNITLQCSAEGSPQPAIIWTRSKSDTAVVESNRHTLFSDGSLKIASLRGSDGGTYICQASNSHGTSSTTVHLDVIETEDVCGVLWDEEVEDDVTTSARRKKRVVEGEALHIRHWPWQVRESTT